MQVTGRTQIEVNGKQYRVVWYGEHALVSMLTKRGWRTMNGYGKADHVGLSAKITALAKAREG